MSELELSELKEWLTNEVKLQRYLDKLTSHGFCSLESMKDLTEDDLDIVGIIPSYHRTRILKFCKSLSEKKDETAHVNDASLALTGSNSTETSDVIVDSTNEDHISLTIEPDEEPNDFAPPPLPPKKTTQTKPQAPQAPQVPDRESSLPRSSVPQESLLTGVQYDSTLNALPSVTEHEKKPPPIPPRADLVEDSEQCTTRESNGDVDESVTIIDVGEEKEVTVDDNLATRDQTEEMSSSSVLKESEFVSPKPKPKPRRIGSTNKTQQGNEHSTSAEREPDVRHEYNACQSANDNSLEHPQKPLAKPHPRPRPRPPIRPVSVAVQPRPEQEKSHKGGSLNRYPIPQSPFNSDDHSTLQPEGEYIF